MAIVDDMESDNVLDYNGFALHLRNKYNKIKDFMVIDRESYDHLKKNLKNVMRFIEGDERGQ